jgi:hypothetical protein
MRVTVPEADLVASAALLAVTVTELVDRIVGGAVYSPLDEIVPVAGAMDHVTLVLLVPPTVGVKV